MPLSHFHPAVADWFTAHFDQPTEVQAQVRPAIREGKASLNAALFTAMVCRSQPAVRVKSLIYNQFPRNSNGDQNHLKKTQPSRTISFNSTTITITSGVRDQ